MSFRECGSGEAIEDDKCVVCPFGRYSFLVDSEQCEVCMDNAECEGGNVVKVADGYWRQFENSTDIFECPNTDACVGGYLAPEERGEDGFPVKCANGYTGYLC